MSERPRLGSITHADGSTTPIFFEPSLGDPNAFHPVNVDGSPVVGLPAGSQIHVDVIAPGQMVALPMPGQE